MDRDRFFGGHPVAVMVRLALLSIVVGIVLSALDITPDKLFDHLKLWARRVYDMGFDAFEWILGYFVIGALVVFPIWFVGRLLGAFRRRSDDHGR